MVTTSPTASRISRIFRNNFIAIVGSRPDRPLAYCPLHDATSTRRDDRSRPAVESLGFARPGSGWHLRLCRDVDGRVLPAGMPEPPAAGGSRALFRYADGSQ